MEEDLRKNNEIIEAFQYINNNIITSNQYIGNSAAIDLWIKEVRRTSEETQLSVKSDATISSNIDTNTKWKESVIQKLLEIKQKDIQYNKFKNDDIQKKEKIFNRENNFINNKFAFILIIKNRNKQSQLFIKNLSKLNDINHYSKLIIVEDTSSDNLNINNITANLNIDYYLVDTGCSWSRSKLINYGLSKNDCNYSIVCDVDFVFPISFFTSLQKKFKNFNFEENILALPVMETNNTYNITNDLLRSKHSMYGNYYIIHTQSIIFNNGYNFNITGHGFEEREFHLRMIDQGINIFFFDYKDGDFNDFIALHLSHNDEIRGELRSLKERKIILQNMSNVKCFEYKLKEINSKIIEVKN